MIKLFTSMAMAGLWLAATLLGTPEDGQFVLCHGADGHVALEPAHEAPCDGGQVTAARAEVGIVTAADCTDVPANRHPAHQTAKRPTDHFGSKRQSPPSWSDAFRADVFADARSVLEGNGPPHVAQSPRHLALLKTVVLRL